MIQLPKINILLIEDDKFLSRLITNKLVREGFNVTAAVDGEGGLVELESSKPDIILLDILLPGIDGFEVLKRVKSKDSKLKSVPVILLSNLGEDEYVAKGLSLGASDYMIKSNFTTDEIVKKITQILGATKI